MILDIYKKAFAKLAEKPFKLWGISLLSILLAGLAATLFPIPGVHLAIQWLLETAMCIVFLNGYTGKEVRCDQLFACFKDWKTIKRVLAGIGWMTLWVFLWSLIPVVGVVFGIIRAYEYRLTPYILVNEPEIGIKEAIEVSKQRTEGYKGKMFLADIIWIAYAILTIILFGALSTIRYVGWLFGIINMVLILAVLALGFLFQGLVQSAFYVEIHKCVPGSPYYIPNYVPNPTRAQMRYCANCGNPMFENEIFCSRCGTRNADNAPAPSGFYPAHPIYPSAEARPDSGAYVSGNAISPNEQAQTLVISVSPDGIPPVENPVNPVEPETGFIPADENKDAE